MNALVCDAIRARRLLRFVYDGYERVVEPHLYGINTADREMLSGWLVGGWSRSGAEPGWRSYLVRDMVDVHVLAEGFDAAREGYDPHDDAFRQLFCRLESAAEVDAGRVRALLARLDAAWRAERWEELGRCFDPQVVIAVPGLAARAEGCHAVVESYRAFMERSTLVRYHAAPPVVEVWGDTAVGTMGWEMVWESEGTPHHETGHDVLVCRRAPGAADGWVVVWRTQVPGAPAAG